ncbi:hypothetical protein BP6252_06480 [Coleophoma cylindrospora]|uniref:2EXR domain-containing protein n=1 Tax=Coleophoma cylindrospora TaxID=1849047 RepID=A0A3D8RN18_9HELO|nr:hypothetical protein BP6252_06480 [Coleophoma cylindrospora]
MEVRTGSDQFMDLPKEIRTMIWRFTFTPRLMIFRAFGCPSFEADHAAQVAPCFMIKAFSPPPSALAVSLESRAAAVEAGYQPFIYADNKSNLRQAVWNPNIDIIFLPSGRSFNCFDWFANIFPEEVRQIRRLHTKSFLEWPLRLPGDDEQCMTTFESLEELVVVHDNFLQHCCPYGRDAPSWTPTSRFLLWLPGDCDKITTRMRAKWPGWKFPAVTVFGSHEQMLECVSKRTVDWQVT